MSNRAIRRAAKFAQQTPTGRPETEHQALKAAAEQQPQQVMTAAAAGPVTTPLSPNVDFADQPEPTPRPVSDAQLAANRANAQKSTGPVSATGRAKSSLNAVKTGLTGQTVLLSSDDAVAYQSHLDRHFTRYAPANDEEHTLVQMIADAEWRVLRIPALEASIHAVGRRKFADLHPEETDPAVRDALIQGEILLAYRRDLSNLALQERRLRNQHKADLAKLQALQTERLEKKNEKGKIQASMMKAINIMYDARKTFGQFDPSAFGFEFSVAEIEYCDQVLEAAHRRSQAA